MSMLACGTSEIAACSVSAMSALVTTSTRSGGTSGDRRATVSAISGRSFTSASTCLGRRGVLSGQKRVPMPPAKTTAHMAVPVSSSASSSTSSSVPAERARSAVTEVGAFGLTTRVSDIGQRLSRGKTSPGAPSAG